MKKLSENKRLKKYLFITLIISLIIYIFFSIRFGINDDFINKYNKGEYTDWQFGYLTKLNIYEPYVAYKNYGDYYYQVGQYKASLPQYDTALSFRMSKNKSCKIRINATLSIIQLIMQNGEEKKEENTELAKKGLEYVENDNCLTLDSFDQDRIDAELLIELLKSGGSDGGECDPESEDCEEKEKSSEIEECQEGDIDCDKDNPIDQIEKENQQGRTIDNENRDHYDNVADNYNGKKW